MNMKNVEFWIPLVTWIIMVIAVTFFIFASYEVSPPVIFAYAVIIVVGFYTLFRVRKKGRK